VEGCVAVVFEVGLANVGGVVLEDATNEEDVVEVDGSAEPYLDGNPGCWSVGAGV
jgi:hypothetical protein